jgi:hypothetical protein
MIFFEDFYKLYWDKSGYHIDDDLKKLGIKDPAKFISIILEWYFFAMYFGIVPAGGNADSRKKFVDLAISHYPQYDKRAFELSLTGMMIMQAIADREGGVAKLYLQAQEWPNDANLLRSRIEADAVNDNWEFWRTTGEALEPVGPLLEGASEFGEVFIQGIGDTKKYIIAGIVLIIIYMMMRKK